MNKNVSNVLNGKTVSVPRKRYGVFKTFFAVRYGNFILTATVGICMYVYKYSVDVYLLCMIKVRVRWYTCSL